MQQYSVLVSLVKLGGCRGRRNNRVKMLEMKMDDCYWRRGVAVTKDEECTYIQRGGLSSFGNWLSSM